MAGWTGPNHPVKLALGVNAQEPLHELETRAERVDLLTGRLWCDTRNVIRAVGGWFAHARSRRPSVSRVPEIGMHGLNGGLPLHR